MKPPPFDYADPTTLDEALELLAEAGDDAAIIAGGQSLIPLLNLRLARPALVIDLRCIPQLSVFRLAGDGLHAGAMARAIDIEEHPRVGEVPGLAPALSLIGHSQIRARTTVGGSIAHADPAAELPALLVALEGTVTLQSRDRGERVVGGADFLVGPLMTDRAADELLVGVQLPVHPGRVVIDEVASRPGDFAIAGAITGYARSSGSITWPRVVVFGVGGVPVRVPEAEAVLDGAPVDSDVFAAAAAAVRDSIAPRPDIHGSSDYRRHLAGELVERNLKAIA